MNIYTKVIRIFIFFVALTSSSFLYAEIKIIGSNNIPADFLTKEDVKNIYLGEKCRWSNDEKITVTMLVKGKIQAEFHRKFLGIDLNKFIYIWRIKIYRRQGLFPKTFDNEEKMLQYIATHLNAIGYVSDEADINYVKTFLIEE